MIEVMQAFQNGKAIEVTLLKNYGDAEWKKTTDPAWNWHVCDYRVVIAKPVINWSHVNPEYHWMATDDDGETYLYKTKPMIDSYLNRWNYEGPHDHDNEMRITYRNMSDLNIESIFASFVPGDCDWKDSLVERS